VGAMIPILFSEKVTSKEFNGIPIDGVTSCLVEETEEGFFELEMHIEKNSVSFKKIKVDQTLIEAKSNDSGKFETFRVYDISESFSNLAKIKARHISYDMTNIAVSFLKKWLDPTQSLVFSKLEFFYSKIRENHYPHKLDGTVDPDGNLGVDKEYFFKLYPQNANDVTANPGEFDNLNDGIFGLRDFLKEKLTPIFSKEKKGRFKPSCETVKRNVEYYQEGVQFRKKATVKIPTFEWVWYEDKGRVFQKGINVLNFQRSEKITNKRYTHIFAAYPYKGQKVLYDIKEIEYDGYNVTNRPPNVYIIPYSSLNIKDEMTESEISLILNDAVKSASKYLYAPISATLDIVDLSQAIEGIGLNLSPVTIGEKISFVYDSNIYSLDCTGIIYDTLNEKIKSIRLGEARKNIIDSIYDLRKEIKTWKTIL
jgi:hypothetical protein